MSRDVLSCEVGLGGGRCLEGVEVLKPLAKDEKAVYRFSTLDIETTEQGEYLLGAVFDGQNYRVFHTVDDLAQFVVGNPSVYYAHCGIGFDYALMYAALVKIATVSVSLSGSSGVYMDAGKSCLLDSYRLLPASLAKLTKMFCPEMAKIELSCMPWELSQEDLEEYLERDCRALYLVVQRFYAVIMEHFGNLHSKTLAALALKIFRRKYQDRDIWNSSHSLYRHEQESYFGGMVYVAPGVYDASYVYDVNSMYPHAMLGEFPYHYLGRWTRDFKGDSVGLYRIKYSTKGIPLVFDSESRSLANEGTSVVCSDTVKYLIDRGDSVKVVEGYEYFRVARLFEPCIRDLYRLRLESPEPLNYCFKILLNSLYGKFGQRRSTRTISTKLPKEYIGKAKVYVFGGVEVFDYAEERMVSNSVPCIASMITSRARLRLHSFADSDTIYMDTDSIHSRVARPDIPISQELGDFKLEVEGEQACYLGKKLYQIGEKKRAKGIPIESMSFVSLFEMYSPRSFAYDGFPSILQQIRSGSGFERKSLVRTINHHLDAASAE